MNEYNIIEDSTEVPPKQTKQQKQNYQTIQQSHLLCIYPKEIKSVCQRSTSTPIFDIALYNNQVPAPPYLT